MDVVTHYLPIAGTGGSQDPWVMNPSGAFTTMMAENNFMPLRSRDGAPLFNWNGRLNGLWWLTGSRAWREAGLALATVLLDVPWHSRNLIAHSHGGQVALLAVLHLAAVGEGIRTLTTVGTPRRKDIDAERAAEHIGFWQHLHDARSDSIATLKRLGQIGDGTWSTERRFLIPGVVNCGVPNIGHSKLFTDPAAMTLWRENGWLENIRTAGASAGGTAA